MAIQMQDIDKSPKEDGRRFRGRHIVLATPCPRCACRIGSKVWRTYRGCGHPRDDLNDRRPDGQ